MNKQIVAEAAEWFVEFSTDEVDHATRHRFDEWLRASPTHLQAFLALVPIWEEGTKTPSPATTPEALIAWAQARNNVVPLEASITPTAPPSNQHSFRWSRRRSAALVAGAALAAIILAGGWYATRMPVYATQIGEQRSIELTDGSIVELNAHSRVRVHFSPEMRAVDLLEGQALFRVAKDPARPFVVESDAARVRAIGTEFDVDQRRSGTTVTVLEGRIAVSPGAAAPLSTTPGELLLNVGEQVTLGAQAPPHMTHADAVAVTAWRQRQLVFNKASLRDVAEEFNRYNSRRLTVDDPELQGLVISGVFSSTDPASLVRFLRAQPGMEVTESSREIHVTHQQQSSTR
jgi:transmembrane sensor